MALTLVPDFQMEHYKDPGNMAYSRDEKSFPARVMTTLWISVPFKTRMSLRERTRPGLGIMSLAYHLPRRCRLRGQAGFTKSSMMAFAFWRGAI